MPANAHVIGKVSRAIEFVENNLPEKLTLERIAAAAFCSKYHFHRLFARYMGMTLRDYLQRRRLTEAARRLVFSQTPILHIALEAGYESQQAFATIFKLMYKAPPGRFRENAVFYPLQLPAVVGTSYPPLGSNEIFPVVRQANHEDIPAWMCLLRQVVDGFPCIREEKCIPALRDAIFRNRAFIIPGEGSAAGAMIFCREKCSIEFLAAHPFYRHTGVNKTLLEQAFHRLPNNGRELSITSYREGDKADTGHRKALEQLGFTPAELLTEFGYPTQKFILKRNNHQWRRKR